MRRIAVCPGDRLIHSKIEAGKSDACLALCLLALAPLAQCVDGICVAAGVVPADVCVRVGGERRLVDVCAALAEQCTQVGGHEVPAEEVLLAAVAAIDGDPLDAVRCERRPE